MSGVVALADVDGVGPATEETLASVADICTAGELAEADTDTLTGLSGIGERRAASLQAAASDVLARTDGGTAVADDTAAGPEPTPERPSDDVVATICTSGDPIQSLVALPSVLVDELRLHVTEDGLDFAAVDPPHVGLVSASAPAEGFETFDVEREVTVGLNLVRFEKAVSWARKGRGSSGGDPVRIELLEDPARVRVQVTRPDQSVARRTEWFTLDPDSIREEPELPDLDLPCTATPDVAALGDAVGTFEHEHAHLSRSGTTMVLATRADGSTEPVEQPSVEDDVGESVMFPNAAHDEGDDGVSSVFNLDYLADFTSALKRSKADRVTIRWGDEFPAMLAFEHEDWGFSGEFMLAPRIQSEGGA